MSISKNRLDNFFSFVTLFGSPIFYGLLIFVLLKIDIYFAIKISLFLAFTEIICVFIKIVYRKERPILQARNNLYNKIDANSFPSVHSARIALLAVMFMLNYKNVLIALLGIVLMFFVGYSRIYLKRHYFVDVLVGYLLGTCVALIAFI